MGKRRKSYGSEKTVGGLDERGRNPKLTAGAREK